MLLGPLFHAAIRTADLDTTVRFYTEVLGMLVAERPPIGFPGAWLKPASEPHCGADAFKALPGLIHVSPNKLGYRPSMSHSCYVE